MKMFSIFSGCLGMGLAVFGAEEERALKPGRLEERGGAIVFAEKSKRPLPEGYRLVWEQDFENGGGLESFIFTDPKVWKLSKDDKTRALELTGQSQYQPSVRSPVNIALIGDRVFGDFILEADLIQTGREYGHRDMCIYFGFQDPPKFYYAHIATAADDHAHNIFIVNEAPRVKIARQTTKGVQWGLAIWHKIRVERKVGDGLIKVFFDDMNKPIMVAEDKTFGAGYVGFGSFDDTGKVDNIKIWSREVAMKKAGFFKRKE